MEYFAAFVAFDVGFNNQVESGQRSFHVQTEVAGSKDRYVRTVVTEQGRLLFNERSPYPDDSDPARFRAAVEAYHKRVVAMVEQGEIE